MKIVFFGSSGFALPSLEALVAGGYRISCVVTQPDKPKGRGLALEATRVKLKALEIGLKVYQPESANSKEAVGFIKNLKPDLFVVIAYGQILSRQILELPKIFAINAHASLLPKYRGAAPVNWAIINGDKITGITIIKMDEKMDAGPIMLQKMVNIRENDTVLTLADNLAKLAAGLLLKSLSYIENNNYKLTPQEERMASFSPKLKKEDGLIKWARPSLDIHNLVRGCSHWPGAFTYLGGKLLKISATEVYAAEDKTGVSPGEVMQISKEGIMVATGSGYIIVKELQLEGRKKLGAGEFIIGHKISVGDQLTSNR